MSKIPIEVDIKELKNAVLSLPDPIFRKFIENIDKGKNQKTEKNQVLETLKNISRWNESEIDRIKDTFQKLSMN